MALITAVSGFLLLAVLLFFLQDSLIYHPLRYEADFRSRLPKELVELKFTTDQGEQSAFYLPPESGHPTRMWILFGGNGSSALGWLDVVNAFGKRGSSAFLMVDYPGYGCCEGRPGPAQMDENAERAFGLVCERERTSAAELGAKTGLIGHSLGCAAALRFACNHPVDRLILLSPFTSMLDMAGRKVGWPLKYLLRSDFDNRACMSSLARRNPLPQITVIHGSDDTMIPCSMGNELCSLHPSFTHFEQIPGADHNDIVDAAMKQIVTAMRANSVIAGRHRNGG